MTVELAFKNLHRVGFAPSLKEGTPWGGGNSQEAACSSIDCVKELECCLLRIYTRCVSSPSSVEGVP